MLWEGRQFSRKKWWQIVLEILHWWHHINLSEYLNSYTTATGSVELRVREFVWISPSPKFMFLFSICVSFTSQKVTVSCKEWINFRVNYELSPRTFHFLFKCLSVCLFLIFLVPCYDESYTITNKYLNEYLMGFESATLI